MLFASDTTHSIMSTLDEMGLEKLLALPAVPVHNPRRMRYPMTVRTSIDGELFYLRSFGTGFDLVDPARRASIGGWYSVGWGMCDGREVAELLLVHVLRERPELNGLSVEIGELLPRTPIRSEIGHGACGHELRMCAVLDRTLREV